MSKICPNCQAAISDDDKFCAACGAEIEAASEPVVQAEAEPEAEEAAVPTGEAVPTASEAEVPDQQPSMAEPLSAEQNQEVSQGAVPYGAQTVPDIQGQAVKKSGGKGLLIAIIVIIIALCVGAGFLLYFILFSGGGYKSAVESYIEYMESYDQDDLVKAIGNDALVYYVEEEYESDMETFNKGCDLMENMNDIVDVDVDYRITDSTEMSSDELKDYEAGDYKVTEGYMVDVEIAMNGDGIMSGLSGQNNTETLTVIKFGSDWCVVEAAETVESIIQAGEGANALSGIDFDELDF